MKKKKVVAIVSCPRSGSTLLELVLCAHSKCFGIGEAYLLFDPAKNRFDEVDQTRCTCNQIISECEFWKQFIIQLRSSGEESVYSKYSLLLDHCKNNTQVDSVIIDSSKLLRSLEYWEKMPDIDLRVLFLVKDVRSWTVSQQDSYRRSNQYDFFQLLRKRGLFAIPSYLRRTSIANYIYWYWKNRRYSKFISEHKIPSIIVKYEDICLESKKTILRICDFIGFDFEKNMLDLENATSHNIFGNRMRFQSDKCKKISYDYRWFYKNDWLIPSLLLPLITRYNKRLYGRKISEKWEK